MNSYFEIGGELVQVTVDSLQHIHSYLPQVVGPGPRNRSAATAAKQLPPGVSFDSIVERGFAKAGAAKRATTALRMAAALALVDGPIPVGDVLAATLLFGYAGYEATRILTE